MSTAARPDLTAELDGWAPHPAKFSTSILNKLDELLNTWCANLEPPRPLTVLDPFAGVGRVHRLSETHHRFGQHATVGVELEPEWAAIPPPEGARGVTLRGDARQLLELFGPATFDALVTSPCYGNRMADHHEARDDSRRYTYRHFLGRRLSAGSSAGLPWGEAYRLFHRHVWGQAFEVLRPGALVLLNVSDHYATPEPGAPRVLQRVAEWHIVTWLSFGCQLLGAYPITTPRSRHGANRDRVPFELVAAFTTPGGSTS